MDYRRDEAGRDHQRQRDADSLEKIAEHYEPPFLEVDVMGVTIRDGVTVGGK